MGQQSVSFGVQQWQALYRTLSDENLGWGCDEPVTVSLTEGVYKFSCDEADRLYGILKGLDKSDGERDGKILLDKALKFYKPEGFSGIHLQNGRVVPITAEVLSAQYDKKFEELLQYLGSEKIEVKINEYDPRVIDLNEPAFLRAIALEAFDNHWDREGLEKVRQQFREAGIPTLVLSFRVRDHAFGLHTSCVRATPNNNIARQLGVPEAARYYYSLDVSASRYLPFHPELSEETTIPLNAEELLLHGAVYDYFADRYGNAQTSLIFWAQLQRYLLEQNPNWNASEIETLDKAFASPDLAQGMLETLVISSRSQMRMDFYRQVYSTEVLQPQLNAWRGLKDKEVQKISPDETRFIFGTASLAVIATHLGLQQEAVKLKSLFFKHAEPQARRDYENFFGVLQKIWGTLDRDDGFQNPLIK